MAYSFIHVVYVPTKHIAYFLSFFLCLFSLFFLFICRCSLALSRTLQVSKLGYSTTTSALESNLYFIYASTSFTFHVRIMALVCQIPLDIVLMFYFDNGGVHNLLVGSEPTHCDGYASLCILHIAAYLVSYHWWGETLWFMTILCFICFMICRAMFPCLV